MFERTYSGNWWPLTDKDGNRREPKTAHEAAAWSEYCFKHWTFKQCVKCAQEQSSDILRPEGK